MTNCVVLLAADDEPRCGVVFIHKLPDDGLLQLHSADDIVVIWPRDVTMKAHVQ